MANLSAEQIKQYEEKGFVAPVEALTRDEAIEIKEEIEFIEKKWPNALDGLGRNYVHLISPIFDKVAHNSKILDAVESIIGENILVCGTTLFVKNPDKKDFDKAAEDLRLATRHLGMIVGKVDVEEILGSIFNDFCIGK